MVHKRETLTKKEWAAQDAFLKSLDIKKRLTPEPVIVVMVGLVGSGKSSVAAELAKRIGGTIVEGDAIRIALRKQSEKYDHARAIGENAAIEVVKRNGNAILDSDFVDQKKRASLRERARQAGVKLVFVRTVCDFDILAGRIITAPYRDDADDFFGGASSPWKGGEQSKGAVVKMREMWRRTPQHYRWVNSVGGKWMPKKLPFAVFVTVDTTDENAWKQAVSKCAKQLGAKS